jgi:hypothetical protein
MAEAGTTIITPVLVKVATAGTAVQLKTSGENFAAKTVLVQALSTNEEAVVVGDKNVKAKAGTHGTPEQRGIELKATQSISLDLVDATQIWVDSRKNEDGVAVLILAA